MWAKVEPLRPELRHQPFDHPGRKPPDHRKVLAGDLFVLHAGLRWNDLPCELGCGSGAGAAGPRRPGTRPGYGGGGHPLLAELNDTGTIGQQGGGGRVVRPDLGRRTGARRASGGSPSLVDTRLAV
ncbi:transposase [bacterium]|nr:transposase [bacterium]